MYKSEKNISFLHTLFYSLIYGFVFLFFISFIVKPIEVKGSPKEKETIYGSIEKEHIKLTSYSPSWNKEKLEDLYTELLANYHQEELNFLGEIRIHPNSPDGVLGYYTEDAFISKDGKVNFGRNATIDLYYGETKKTIKDMAPILAHEYGHHYTIFHMSKYENTYYFNWENSEYAKIRNLKEYPVIYNPFTTTNYRHAWSITEIASNDYVQLLGSPLARQSYNYLDTKEIVDKGLDFIEQPIYFNMMPQENPRIPLATEVEGLFEYMVKVSRSKDTKIPNKPTIEKKPEILTIVEEDYKGGMRFGLHFKKALGEKEYSHTVIMYPKNAPTFVEPIKYIDPSETAYAVFGTHYKENQGDIIYVQNEYLGEYNFIVYAQDEKGHLFSSKPFTYDFGDEEDPWLLVDQEDLEIEFVEDMEDDALYNKEKAG